MNSGLSHLEMLRPTEAVRATGTRFSSGTGASEWYLCLSVSGKVITQIGFDELAAAYDAALVQWGLSRDSAVHRRIYVADFANSRAALERSGLLGHRGEVVAVSVVEQPPLPDGGPALFAYHITCDEPLDKIRVENGVLVRRGPRSHLWLCEIQAFAFEGPFEQTRHLFELLSRSAAAQGATLRDHVVRIWFYCADILENYGDLVLARREVFEAECLTEETHYISSTGIEGRRAEPRCIVSLDAYAIPGLDPAQVRYLVAPERLGPASAYGPTFERGTRVAYGDRAHVLISGTASIDPSGKVVHEGSLEHQVERTLGNVEALLRNGGAGLQDVAYMIVYVRDPADSALVTKFLDERCPGTPKILTRASVCREAWLVEIECIAITLVEDSRWAAF